MLNLAVGYTIVVKLPVQLMDSKISPKCYNVRFVTVLCKAVKFEINFTKQ